MGDGARGELLLQWWRQRDDYEWRIEFLRSRGMLPVLRYLIAGIGAVMGVLGAVNIFVPPVNDTTLIRAGWAVVSIGSLAWSARWALRPWPSERVSALLVAYVDVIMTLSALLFGDPNLAMSGIPILLCAGGYVVFFHGPKLHVAHIVWCVASVLGIAVWMVLSADSYGLQVAVSRSVIALAVTVCILPALQFGFWLLQGSSIQSVTDPLTELTNRRGLDAAVRRLNESAPPDTDLCALLIDVDGFKAVNDDLGHVVGDQVLIRTARRIKSSVCPHAVVVRWGGEEFLVVDRIMADQAHWVAERIRASVAVPDEPRVTVSVGVAVCTEPVSGLDGVIPAADRAMYEAKALGGDCVVMAEKAH
ncbi:MAG: diguanylate cyclase [Mycolicibacterium neoaurum]|uniref:GGDEF domain-containing protein n=1 Tax=Mycolicibacterium neoaurum TaxID=1795 RepID=UPI002FF4ABBB